MGDTLKVLFGDAPHGVTPDFVSKFKQWANGASTEKIPVRVGLRHLYLVRSLGRPLVEARFDSGDVATVELELDGFNGIMQRTVKRGLARHFEQLVLLLAFLGVPPVA